MKNDLEFVPSHVSRSFMHYVAFYTAWDDTVTQRDISGWLSGDVDNISAQKLATGGNLYVGSRYERFVHS